MANEFLIVGFTIPDDKVMVEEESHAISLFLRSGAIDYFHIRKTAIIDIGHVKKLIDGIPEELHKRLVLHSHFELFPKYRFGGIHFKKESAAVPTPGFAIHTRSCHSLGEIDEGGSFTYSFLSPIFDSISKQGYRSEFSLEDVALQNTIVGRNIIALGGVRPEDFQKLNESKFGGAALLGYLWSPNLSLEDKIRQLCDSKRKIVIKQKK